MEMKRKTRKKHCIQYEIPYILNKPEWETLMEKEQETIKPEYREKFENTYKYMYNEIGYGVFVRIVENKIEMFQAFVNTDSPKPETNQIPTTEIEKYRDRFFYKVSKDRNHWGFNGCVFLYNHHWWKYDEFKIRIYYDMLLHLIKKNTTTINTCFFINILDKPIISKNIQKKYIPVLSGSTNIHQYNDKCMIYLDAWEIYRQFPFERYIRTIGKTCENQYITKVETEWRSKQNKIIFRGTNSSCYPTAFKQNIRLKMINIMQKIKQQKISENKIDIDIGLIKLKNKLSRVEITDHKIHFSNDASLTRKIHSVHKKSKYEQSKCKYILCMDGYVTPWRLCFELSYGSCIFLIRSQYTSWFYHELRHKENVVIFDESSPNLEEEIREALIYYSNHDEEARRIGENAKKLYKKIMHIDYMRNYMLDIFRAPEFQNILLTDSPNSLHSKTNKKISTKKRNHHQTRKIIN
jgi:hypothetical protein